jgi:hypothetical protein
VGDGPGGSRQRLAARRAREGSWVRRISADLGGSRDLGVALGLGDRTGVGGGRIQARPAAGESGVHVAMHFKISYIYKYMILI